MFSKELLAATYRRFPSNNLDKFVSSFGLNFYDGIKIVKLFLVYQASNSLGARLFTMFDKIIFQVDLGALLSAVDLKTSCDDYFIQIQNCSLGKIGFPPPEGHTPMNYLRKLAYAA